MMPSDLPVLPVLPSKPGIYFGLSFEQYKQIKAINKSGLDTIATSALHYFDKHLADDRVQEEPTDEMVLGTAIHTYVLEPGEFSKRYVIVPDDAPKKPTAAQWKAKKPSEEGQASIDFWTKFNEAAGDREVISIKDFLICQKIADRIRTHPAAQVLFENARTEVTILWETEVDIGEDEPFVVLCKGRIDLLSSVILDLKSAMSAASSKFGKKAADLGYQIQAAWYFDGYQKAQEQSGATEIDILPFVFGAFEKKRPFACAFHIAKDSDLAQGRSIYNFLLVRYCKSLKSNKWPGYPETIQDLKLPAWSGRDIDYDPAE